MNKAPIFDYPLFALGFRPFFTLAGWSALVFIALWKSVYDGTFTLAPYFSAVNWHAHEMLLGYTGAVLAGFLLTAVQNWTGQPTLRGDKLAGLCLLWLYGRVLPFWADELPHALIALIDLSFLPILAYCLAKPILASCKLKNAVFPAFLGLMTIGNLLIHSQLLGFSSHSADSGFTLVLATLVMIILVIAGRILPFFTERGLSNVLILPNPIINYAAIIFAAGVFILQLFQINGTLLFVMALLAALVNLIRMANWIDRRIIYIPLLWILYAGYSWLIIGFILTAFTAYAWVSPSLALHSFTIGGIGVLTLGMMARVSLGHTGRPLRVANNIALAFIIINIAALCRIILPMAFPRAYDTFIYISLLSWLAAFSLFVFIYTPILTTARIDNKEG